MYVNLENLLGGGFIGDMANKILTLIGEDFLYTHKDTLAVTAKQAYKAIIDKILTLDLLQSSSWSWNNNVHDFHSINNCILSWHVKKSQINAMIACPKMGACTSKLLHITKNSIIFLNMSSCHSNNQVGSFFCFLWAVFLINIAWEDSCICSSSLAFLDSSRLVSFCYKV